MVSVHLKIVWGKEIWSSLWGYVEYPLYKLSTLSFCWMLLFLISKLENCKIRLALQITADQNILCVCLHGTHSSSSSITLPNKYSKWYWVLKTMKGVHCRHGLYFNLIFLIFHHFLGFCHSWWTPLSLLLLLQDTCQLYPRPQTCNRDFGELHRSVPLRSLSNHKNVFWWTHLQDHKNMFFSCW